ncbi:MAG: hypothetical protein OCD00_17395 [Colwellia sp.]
MAVKCQPPNALREQAVALLKYYSSSKITSALRISGGQLKQWKNSVSSPENTPQFVQLPISAPSAQTPFNVELCFAQSTVKHFLTLKVTLQTEH